MDAGTQTHLEAFPSEKCSSRRIRERTSLNDNPRLDALVGLNLKLSRLDCDTANNDLMRGYDSFVGYFSAHYGGRKP
ncbi:hypothetical protein [Sphingomonas prati]|uniref:Uncharacterized protein n=1 Tax=Sphingomonas prati TaxID=1843237 RepID=A0A7W9BVX1_9SPHN|nr:hypothetical protein [Sphingomonas prati]MBB5730854.1 hypothetical protein [Sphingomonas prati]GGE97208.1 hypothetical protein GCM10011404_32940 [Sphingomonas prati]